MKFGFACQFVSDAQERKLQIQEQSPLRMKTTTVKAFTSLSADLAYQKLLDVVKHNVTAVYQLIAHVSQYPETMRMVRISSDVLPMFTHPAAAEFYRDPAATTLIEQVLHRAGKVARRFGVKVSFHPGQFTVLASDSDGVIANAVAEFEYHVYLLYSMGFCRKKLDAKCNVHLSGRGGIPKFKQTWNKLLSPEARRVLTLENDEHVMGIDDLLTIGKHVPIVLDVHHHWCKTGEYISASDRRVQQVVDSWRGERPTLHYSNSREEYIGKLRGMPNLNRLVSSGVPMSKLRAHSYLYGNKALNDWACTFSQFDVMCEAKGKNLASYQLHCHYYGE